MPVLQGATWNTSLIREIAEINALELRSSGGDQALSPILQVCTDPRFGRMEENFAEDPFLVASYGVAAVHGLQGDDGLGGASEYVGSPETHVMSQAKHFAMCELRLSSLDAESVLKSTGYLCADAPLPCVHQTVPDPRMATHPWGVDPANALCSRCDYRLSVLTRPVRSPHRTAQWLNVTHMFVLSLSISDSWNVSGVPATMARLRYCRRPWRHGRTQHD